MKSYVRCRQIRLTRRRGYGLLELTLSAFLLVTTMGMTVKVLTWVGSERRAAERRQWASGELSNAMERVVARPFERVDAEQARGVLEAIFRKNPLPGAEWWADVFDEVGCTIPSKRVSLRVRWKNRGGEWDAPVRLTSWVYRKGRAS